MIIEFDMFENTGHEDMHIGMDSIDEILETIEEVDLGIPQSFDFSILQKEELPIPFQNKICHTKQKTSNQKTRPETDSITEQKVSENNYFRQLTLDSFPHLEKNSLITATPIREETIERVDLFFNGGKVKTVTANRNSFHRVKGNYKARLTTKTLVTHIQDIPGYRRHLQQMQMLLDDINELRQQGNMPEWTMKTLTETKITHQDDFLSYKFRRYQRNTEWTRHEIEGAETQYDEDINHYEFFYVPTRQNNKFDKAVNSIIKDAQSLSIINLAIKAYKLPKSLAFSTKGLPINLKSGGRIIRYEVEGECLLITFPWVEGIKFSSVNYDRECFKLA